MSFKAPASPPCPDCGAEFVCSECGDPCMIVVRCAPRLADPPYCRKPDDPPPLCAECYTKKALAEEAATLPEGGP